MLRETQFQKNCLEKCREKIPILFSKLDKLFGNKIDLTTPFYIDEILHNPVFYTRVNDTKLVVVANCTTVSLRITIHECNVDINAIKNNYPIFKLDFKMVSIFNDEKCKELVKYYLDKLKKTRSYRPNPYDTISQDKIQWANKVYPILKQLR